MENAAGSPSPSDDKSMADFTAALKKYGEFYPTGPSCWGPLQWMAMHQMARGFPLHNPSEAKQAAVKAYVIALADVLPCNICATHWRAIAPTVDTSSRNAFLKWTIDVHNSVNKRTQKAVMSYHDAIEAIILQCVDNRLSICGKQNTPSSSSSASLPSSSAIPALAATSILFAVAMIVFFVLFMHARRR